ncbi:MAG: FtsX-like permease family protein, partial [Bacteroidota bacterium]
LLIAFFLLMIAWINYVNLSSVRAIERSKEVGVRKVVGAGRGQLLRQFFSEALMINVISLIFALGIVQFITPWFAAQFDLDASILGFFNGHHLNVYLVLTLLALILTGVFVSGVYPAWLLSSPQISSVLKGVFKRDLKGVVLRKVLVVLQFSLSIALIAATWMVGEQLSFMTQRDLGFKADQLIRINSPEMSNFDSSFIDRMNLFKTELSSIPGIESAATSNQVPGDQMGRVFQIRLLGDGQSAKTYTSNFLNADFDYAKTYGLKPLAGRFFRREDHNSDFVKLSNIVVTEATVKMLNIEQHEAAIGRQLNFYNRDWNIVGILPDFHQRSLHHAIEPIIFLPSYSPNNFLTLRVNRENIEQTLASVQIAYRQFFPGNTFNYTFLDEHFKRLYEADLRFSSILALFTLLTIFIACLGLFGLASYTTYLRTKEIGIRKILGASTGGIIGLLSKDFLKLILIALFIGAPIAWLFMDKWLENFAYRIEIHWWMFFLAGLAAVLVAFITVSIQGLRVALSNPADSLRSE